MARLGTIAAHLRGTMATPHLAAPAATVETAPENDHVPLTTAQLDEFLERGCLILSASEVPPEAHARIYARCRALADDNPANGIFACVPELGAVFDSPTVAGALRSVLGENYLMHRHRHMHSSSGRDQVFHKDSHCAPLSPAPPAPPPITPPPH